MTNSTCPTHSDRALVRNGKTKAGSQRWRCTDCGYSRADGLSQGGQLLGETRLTNAEYQKRHREKRRSSG